MESLNELQREINEEGTTTISVTLPVHIVEGPRSSAPSSEALQYATNALVEETKWLPSQLFEYAIAAEVPASRLRVKTIALGRNTYYLISIVNSVVTPYELNPSYGNLKGKAGFVAAAFTLCMLVWAFFRLPETKGRTYEELDVLFDQKVPARQFGVAGQQPIYVDARNFPELGQCKQDLLGRRARGLVRKAQNSSMLAYSRPTLLVVVGR